MLQSRVRPILLFGFQGDIVSVISGLSTVYRRGSLERRGSENSFARKIFSLQPHHEPQKDAQKPRFP